MRSTGPLVHRRQVLAGLGAAGVVGMGWTANQTRAQFMARPIRFYYPYTAGSTGDSLLRILATKMGQLLNTPAIVDNKPGASGRIGIKAALTAAPDGKNILFSPIAPIVLHPSIYPALGYNPLTDAVPVAQVVTFDFCCVVSPRLNISKMQDLVAWLKAHPDQANCAVVGQGAVHNFMLFVFAKVIGVEIRSIFYRGSAGIMTDIWGGQVPFAFVITSEATEMHLNGTAKILATSGDQRSPLLPAVPTFKETGFDVGAEGWFGFFTQVKTPADKIAELEGAALESMRTPDIRERALRFGYTPTGLGARAFSEIIKADYAKWAPVIKASGYQPVD